MLAHANNTLIITLVNNSGFDLELDYIDPAYPANNISINKNIIKSQDSGIITCETTTGYDILANIFFKNNMRMKIRDNRQFHMGQPEFKVFGSQILSELKSKTRNPVTGPRYIMYIEAEVIVRNNLF